MTPGSSEEVCSGGATHVGVTFPLVMLQPEHAFHAEHSKHTVSKRADMSSYLLKSQKESQRAYVCKKCQSV